VLLLLADAAVGHGHQRIRSRGLAGIRGAAGVVGERVRGGGSRQQGRQTERQAHQPSGIGQGCRSRGCMRI
jgi:hypothetical protein